MGVHIFRIEYNIVSKNSAGINKVNPVFYVGEHSILNWLLGKWQDSFFFSSDNHAHSKLANTFNPGVSSLLNLEWRLA